MVTADTIRVDLKDVMKSAARAGLPNAVKHEDKYYSIFKERGLYYFYGTTKRFLY